jgi:hypothetical protein
VIVTIRNRFIDVVRQRDREHRNLRVVRARQVGSGNRIDPRAGSRAASSRIPGEPR